MTANSETTQLLRLAARGDAKAGERLLPAVYEQLRELAGRYVRGPQGPAALQPTALVHEAYLKLVDQVEADFRSRTHFFAVAARAMKQVLLDEVKYRMRLKRGGGRTALTLHDSLDVSGRGEVALDDLDEALTRLADLDPRAAQVVELRFFAGLTEAEISHELGVSERTVRNDWGMARAWLYCTLSEPDHDRRP